MFTLQGLAALCPGIAASPSILRLILDGKGLTAESCIPLAEALSQNSSLRELDLSRNDITCTGLASLANALGTLRRLSLATCALSGAEAGCVLSQILSTTNIEILRLEDNPIDATFITPAAPGLKVAPSLIELHLGNCPLGSDGITRLFNNLPPTLKFLDVSGCSAGPAGLDAAGQALAAGAAPGLRRLMICDGGGDDASLAACINGASHLLQLDLSGNVVGPQAIKALAACSGLHSVCLHNCKMGSEGCQALCTEAEAQPGQAFQTLKELDLSGNGLETADLVALLGLLRSTSAACPALEQLVLAANPGAMEEAVIEATQALQSVRHGLDVVRRSADTGERDGKQHQQQFPTLD